MAGGANDFATRSFNEQTGGIGTVAEPSAEGIDQVKTTQVGAGTSTILLSEESTLDKNRGVGNWRSAVVRTAARQIDGGAGATVDLHLNTKLGYLMVDGHVSRLQPVETVGNQNPEWLTNTNSFLASGMWTVNIGDNEVDPPWAVNTSP